MGKRLVVPISICIIAKNEHEHMEGFLKSIRKAFEGKPIEILVLDTGSTDDTKEIALRYADRVEDFVWVSDFSAARNRSIELASNDWILPLDCDENVISADYNDLQDFIHRCPNVVGRILRHNHYPQNDTDAVFDDRVERFFDRRIYHYVSPIHEQVTPLNEHKTCIIAPVKVEVDHSGYTGDREKLIAKAERNNELLFKMLQKEPDNPYLYFQIGQSYNVLGDNENAAKYFGKALTYDLDPNLEYVKMCVTAYGYALLDLGRYDEVLQFENIYDTFGGNADFDCLMGLINMRVEKPVSAMKYFLKATSYDTCSVVGTNSYIPRYNMGLIDETMGDIDNAVKLYRACGDFKPAVERLKIFNIPEELEGNIGK